MENEIKVLMNKLFAITKGNLGTYSKGFVISDVDAINTNMGDLKPLVANAGLELSYNEGGQFNPKNGQKYEPAFFLRKPLVRDVDSVVNDAVSIFG